MWSDSSYPASKSEAAKCLVCDTEVRSGVFAGAQTGHSGSFNQGGFGNRVAEVCQSLFCQQVWQKKEQMPSSLFEHHLKFQRQVLQEKKARELAMEQHRQKIDIEEKTSNQELFQRLIQRHSNLLNEGASAETHLLSLPSSSSQIIRLTKERITEYRQHLTTVIINAMVTRDAEDVFLRQNEEKASNVEIRLEQSAELAAQSGHFCTMCKGSCCSAGANDGLIDVRLMRRYLLANPDLSPLEVFNSYLSRLSEEVVDSSCINHSANGCVLSKDMRSDVCNGYFCEPVKVHHRRSQKTGVANVMVVVRDYRLFRKYQETADMSVREVAIVPSDPASRILAVNL